ncbi:MAG: serine hydrolase domain-containing protein [Bacteroidota bacterium]
MKNQTFKCLVLLIALFAFTSCEEEVKPTETIACLSGPCFDMDTFAENIKTTMGTDNVGYGFQIWENGNTAKFYTEGMRRTNKEPNPELFTLNNVMHVASISKSISAIALLHALDGHGIDIDEPIYDYLPTDWLKGPHIDQITFRQLLQHRSGFEETLNFSNSHNGLKNMIQYGVIESRIGQYDYDNVNFGLIRILLPGVNGEYYSGFLSDLSYNLSYVGYVQDHVFEPAGLFDVWTKPEENVDPTLCYNRPYNNEEGWNPGDLTAESGGFGWYLSISDLGNMLSTLLYTNKILNTSTRQLFFDEQLGNFKTNGQQGTYHTHNGRWLDGIGRGLNTSYMIFPDMDIHVVIFTNSDPAPMNLGTLLRSAYDNAWN